MSCQIALHYGMINTTCQGTFTHEGALMEHNTMAEKKQARTSQHRRNAPAGAQQAMLALLRKIRPVKVAIFIGSLFLFILAIILMKEGAPGARQFSCK
jgi:hypothetical protein